ncbi:CaiB/BaiF CoA transferase family protein [Tuberibacillus calidus]|uniref:CaiB/BaiF CoA transferase family protein n=1 Tax=Tuberibacillus calidus TaxID=340097 RepID=UPI0003FFED44|nr:CaiB/BaiF CoA-transferase family protein [Tuberibacillus calidus]
MAKALEGIKVIDCSRVLAGPFCTMILGDLGADIIKIEAPGGSDDTRAWGPPFAGGESAYYFSANRNKRALTLNLKTEEGRGILKTLVRDADVLVHNFKPGTMEKWDLHFDRLKTMNQRLIYCGISGFGKTGPYSSMPGYDFVIQAMSGFMSITGPVDGAPHKVGVAITDVLTGLYAALAIQAALIERDRSGTGQEIDLALYDCAVSALVNVASNYLVSKNPPRRLGNRHPNIVPYQTYKARDGEMAIAVGNDRQFRQLCHIIGAPYLADDPRFETNPKRLEHIDELESAINEALRAKSVNDWTALFMQAGIPAGPIQTVDQVFSDPQVKAREMVTELTHPTAGPLSLVASPIKFSKTPVVYERHPPLAGEHTEEILKEYGFTSKQIADWQNSGII